MKRMATAFLSLVALAALALAAGVDGTWKASVPGRDGNTMEMVMKLKAEGEKVTVTVGGPMGDTDITDGKLAGDTVTFKVKREFNGNSMIMNYEGKLAGDEIKFKSTREGSDRPPREFVAKRAN